MSLRLQSYNSKVEYVGGKLKFLVDTLNRAYLSETSESPQGISAIETVNPTTKLMVSDEI